jgi:hypothetical protein
MSLFEYKGKFNPALPYERGNWDQFYEYFLDVLRKYKFAFYNFINTAKTILIEEDSDLEKQVQLPYGHKDEKGNELGGTAFIDLKKDIYIFERFLLEKQINCYELAVIMMHEIMHHALGHMEELKKDALDKNHNPRETNQLVKNIIFDALINSTITRKFNFDQRITSFFEKLYDATKKPDNLLRPGSSFEDPFDQEVYDNLYSKESATFYDLKSLFDEDGGESGQTTILIGGHGASGPSNGGELEAEFDGNPEDLPEFDGNPEDLNEAFEEAAEGIIKDMSDKSNPGGHEANPNARQQFEKVMQDYLTSKQHDLEEDVLLIPTPAEFKHFIDHAFMKIQHNQKRRKVFPHMRDRRMIAYKAMGIHQVFYRVPKKDEAVHAVAYIDVSGSTDAYHHIFFSTIYYNLAHFDAIYAFSTFVHPCSEEDVEKRRFKTSYGTSDCFIEHMIENKIDNAMIFTDGYIGGDHLKELNVENTKFVIVFMDADRGESSGEWFKPVEQCIEEIYTISPEGVFRKLDKLPSR